MANALELIDRLRLRARAEGSSGTANVDGDLRGQDNARLFNEAADEIERLVQRDVATEPTPRHDL